MYDAVADPYCYAGTAILKNAPGIRDQAALDGYEAAMTAPRADEPLPSGRFSGCSTL
jgi:cell filamentation protein